MARRRKRPGELMQEGYINILKKEPRTRSGKRKPSRQRATRNEYGDLTYEDNPDYDAELAAFEAEMAADARADRGDDIGGYDDFDESELY